MTPEKPIRRSRSLKHQHRTLEIFRALAPYLGGKRRLAPVIFGLLQEVLPRSAWPTARLLDPFCGAGAVALYGKAQGFHVIAGDIMSPGTTALVRQGVRDFLGRQLAR